MEISVFGTVGQFTDTTTSKEKTGGGGGGGGGGNDLDNNVVAHPIIQFPDTASSKEGVGSGGDDLHNTNHLVAHPITATETLLHIFKGNVGPGLLAMGDAFRNGGLYFSLALTIILCVINVHCQHILLNCSETMHAIVKTKRPPDFADTVRLVFETGPPRLRPFAAPMAILVDTFLCITQIGFCCIFIVFIGNNLQKFLEQFGVHEHLSILMVYVFIPILLECCIRNLKYLAPLSTIANVCMGAGLAIVLYQASQSLPSPSTRAPIGTLRRLPLFFGTAVYAFEGIGLVLPLKSEMKEPDKFQGRFGVLNVGMALVGSLYTTVGFLGFLKWGEDVQGSLTLNMPPGELITQVVQVVIMVGVLFTYPLQFYVPVDIMWPAVCKRVPYKLGLWPQIVFRILLACLTFVLAESIPHLSLFISLVGAVSSTALALVIPAIIQLVLIHRPDQVSQHTAYIIFKNVPILLFGLFVFFTGTYESVAAIVQAFNT